MAFHSNWNCVHAFNAFFNASPRGPLPGVVAAVRGVVDKLCWILTQHDNYPQGCSLRSVAQLCNSFFCDHSADGDSEQAGGTFAEAFCYRVALDCSLFDVTLETKRLSSVHRKKPHWMGQLFRSCQAKHHHIGNAKEQRRIQEEA